MKDRLIQIIILFFILGSLAISSNDLLSYNARSIFYGVAMATLSSIGIYSLYDFFKKKVTSQRKNQL